MPGRAAVRACAAVLVTAVAVSGCAAPTGRTGRTTAASVTAGRTSETPEATSATASAPGATTGASASRSLTPTDTRSTAVPGALPIVALTGDAAQDVRRATAYLGTGGVSIEAIDLTTRRGVRYGATSGMLSGSIAKLFILETLLLQHQQSGRPLSEDTREQAARMIENSDNDAADDLYVAIGEGPALRRAARVLGVTHTVPGPGIYWGFNRTSAADQVALLHDLVQPGSLEERSRTYALGLLSNVEVDQRWGVSAAADAGTRTRQKNGWLPASPDAGRWLVNSAGIITAHGHTVLIAVLTQHGGDFDEGVALVQKLARITVGALHDR